MRDQLSTAVMSAMYRGAHRVIDGPPLVFDDPWALRLAGVDDTTMGEILGRQPYPPSARQFAVTRARVVEELVDDMYVAGVRQYIMLGAGYDSFALRRQDLDGLALFEVDHPATQDRKRARLDELNASSASRWVPVDFDDGDLADALARAGFNPHQPAVWSWLGVAVYLDRSVIAETLTTVAALSAPGSALAASFTLTPGTMDDVGAGFDTHVSPLAAQRGEPQISRFARAEFADLVGTCGWPDVRVVTTDDVAKWFDGRGDGLRPSTYEEVVVARR